MVMKINKCLVENFTVFEKQDIGFCDGINVLIGANGTGKSHLLKILYAMTRWFSSKESLHKDENGKIKVRFLNLLNGIFKPEEGEIPLLMRKREDDQVADISIKSGSRECLRNGRSQLRQGIFPICSSS